jgi:hypothetical protein
MEIASSRGGMWDVVVSLGPLVGARDAASCDGGRSASPSGRDNALGGVLSQCRLGGPGSRVVSSSETPSALERDGATGLVEERGSGRLGEPGSCCDSASSSSRGDKGASKSRTGEGSRTGGGNRSCGEGSRSEGRGVGSCDGEGSRTGSGEAEWFAQSSSGGGSSFKSKLNSGLACAIVSLLRRRTRINVEKHTQML